MENQKQPQLSDHIQLLALLNATFLNCFYNITVTRLSLRLQGSFYEYPTIRTCYDIPVKFTRTDDGGTHYFEGNLIIEGMTLEIVLTT